MALLDPFGFLPSTPEPMMSPLDLALLRAHRFAEAEYSGQQPRGLALSGPLPYAPAFYGEPIPPSDRIPRPPLQQAGQFGPPAEVVGSIPARRGLTGGINPLALALLAGGLGTLQQSGWQRMPVSLGQALGAGGMQGLQTYIGLSQQQRAEQAAQERFGAEQELRREQLESLREARGVQAETVRARTAAQKRQAALMDAYAKAPPEGKRLILEQMILESKPEALLEGAAKAPTTREVGVGGEMFQKEEWTGGKGWQRVGQPYRKGALVSVDLGKATPKVIAEQLDRSSTAAESAISAQQTVNNMRKILNNPQLITGFGADVRLQANQVLNLLSGGSASAEMLGSTRELIQGLSELTLESRGMMKGQGQITEREQDLLERARGGNFSYSVPELRSLMKVITRLNKAQYLRHQSMLKRAKRLPNADETGVGFFEVDPFPESEEEQQQPLKPWEKDYGKP